MRNFGIREDASLPEQEQRPRPALPTNRPAVAVRRIQDLVRKPLSGRAIQAQKAGILRDIITADRAFTIMITGQPNDFTVHIGVGKSVQNLAVAAAEVIFLSLLFIAVDIPEMVWTCRVEGGIAKEITDIVD